MKKIYLSIVASLVALTLMACGTKDDRPVLTYAGWNLGTVEQNNIERQMLQAFQDMNPDIRVEIIPRPVVIGEDGSESDVGWFDFFTAKAYVNELPDVFQVADITTWVTKGWLDDVSDLVENDPDFALVPEDIAHDAKFDEFLFALPQAMYYYGYFINRTVYQNITGHKYIEYGISFEDLLEAAKANSYYDFMGEGTGIAGIDGISSIYEWLPAQYDDSLDWYTFNSETGYHLNSVAFETALNRRNELLATKFSYILDAQDADERSAQYGTSDPWAIGKQAIKWAASYNLRDWIAKTQTEGDPLYGHDIDFIGTPSVDGTHKIPVIMDHVGIAPGTKMRDKAYELAKWMSFGVEGFKKRIEITKKDPTKGAINFAPITQDVELINAYFELYPTMTEFRKIVETHQYFIRESLWKVTPGYWDSRSNGAFDGSINMGEALNKILNGELNYADEKNKLNSQANLHWQQAKVEFEKAIEKYRNNKK